MLKKLNPGPHSWEEPETHNAVLVYLSGMAISNESTESQLYSPLNTLKNRTKLVHEADKSFLILVIVRLKNSTKYKWT